MNLTTQNLRQPGYRALLHVAVLAIAGFTFALSASNAAAVELMPSDYRVTSGVGKFSNTSQIAVAFRSSAPRFLRAERLPEYLRADRLELTVGTFSTSGRNRAFVSLGPVWRLPLNSSRYFAEFGFSPTLLDGSTFDGRELGGNFHFTSSVAAGVNFGTFNQYSLALRAQHTSNGGLNSTNPGLDTIGLNFSIDFDRR